MGFIALFPGQGSQAVGMGHGFYEKHELAREVFNQADRSLGFPLSELCFHGPIEKLTLTEYAQPALLTVSTIAFTLSNLSPTAAAGHSLGEYSALVAAGCIDFSDAVQLVHKRGRYMQEAVASGAGKMVAVMGPSVEEIRDHLAAITEGIVEIANINCPGQTVVAGDNVGIQNFSNIITPTGAKLIPLNVSAPFHCRLMQPAADRLAADLAAVSFKDPKFPVVANVTAAPVSKGGEARQLLVKQVCATVRWTECVEILLKQFKPDRAIEFGPGGVLVKLLKRIDRSIPGVGVSDSVELQKL